MWFLVLVLIMLGVYINVNQKLQDNTRMGFDVGLAIVIVLIVLKQVLN